MRQYYPFRSDKPEKKFYIITKSGKKVYFGSANYKDFTQHKDEVRKNAYLLRHKKRENWDDPNTAGYWAAKYLWAYPSKEEAYRHIQSDLRKKGYL